MAELKQLHESITLAGWDKTLDEMTLGEMQTVLQLLRWRIVESEFAPDVHGKRRTYYTIVTDEIKPGSSTAVWPKCLEGIPAELLWYRHPEQAARLMLRLHFTTLRREQDAGHQAD